LKLKLNLILDTKFRIIHGSAIKNNGIGISKKYHQQIFEIFKHLHNRDESVLL